MNAYFNIEILNEEIYQLVKAINIINDKTSYLVLNRNLMRQDISIFFIVLPLDLFLLTI